MQLYDLAKVIAPMLICFFMLGVAGYAPAKANAQAAKNTQKAIIVVSFGTTFPDARKACIESVENKIRDSFPDYEVRRAFTSKIVMKRIQEKENLHVDDLEQALNKLKNEGYSEVIVQTTHLTPGEEYDKKVLAVVDKFAKSFNKIEVGRPLLFFKGANGTPDDYAALAGALQKQMPVLQMSGRYVLFMGHGSPHQPNPAYNELQKRFDAAETHAVIGVVEETDHPNFEDAKALLEKRGAKQVLLMPLMLVAGDHANNDMAGDEDDSWKNVLLAKGYQVGAYLHGLGENPAVQDLYVQHVRDVIFGFYKTSK